MLAFAFLATVSAVGPECRWQCDDPVCFAECVPVCEPPRCEAVCPEIIPAPTCLPPVCSLSCTSASNSSVVDSCPSCEIRCNQPICTPVDAVCFNLCEPPDCSWKCTEPKQFQCRHPTCELQCEQPACAASPAATLLSGFCLKAALLWAGIKSVF